MEQNFNFIEQQDDIIAASMLMMTLDLWSSDFY